MSGKINNNNNNNNIIRLYFRPQPIQLQIYKYSIVKHAKNCFTCIVINYTQVFRIYATLISWHYMYSDSRHEVHIYLPLI